MKLYCETCQKAFPAAAEAGAAAVKCPQCGKDIPVPEKKVAPGVVIGDFLIEKPLSHGGMGEVYIARQLSLDRPVALKVLQDRFNKDKEYIDGLFREARAAAKITHPNIVQAYAVGEEDGEAAPSPSPSTPSATAQNKPSPPSPTPPNPAPSRATSRPSASSSSTTSP